MEFIESCPNCSKPLAEEDLDCPNCGQAFCPTCIEMVSLEETEASMRENARKPCLINTKYRIQDREFNSYILDVSVGGVFIETKDGFPKGKDLLLKFSLPNRPHPFTFSGKIAWSSPKGFGVKFDNVTPSQGDILKSFIEQNE